MSEHIKCLRCQSEMESGLLLDTVKYDHVPLRWMEGIPEVGKWLGGVKNVVGSRVYDVQAYRCTDCGYLELYAPK